MASTLKIFVNVLSILSRVRQLSPRSHQKPTHPTAAPRGRQATVVTATAAIHAQCYVRPMIFQNGFCL